MNSEANTFVTMATVIIAVLVVLTVLYIKLYFGKNAYTKENVEKPVQGYAMLVVNSMGILTLFLPWVKIPFFGSYNALELLKYIKFLGGESSSVYYGILATLCIIVANYVVFIITSIDKIRSKIIVNSGGIWSFEVLNPLLVVLLFFILIIGIPFPLSIAPYLIIILGVAQIVISIFLKGEDTYPEFVKNIANKMTVQNDVKQETEAHQDKISQLQQLKQLFDDDILTQQEFDEQKSKILKK
jgi:hypothetical protein